MKYFTIIPAKCVTFDSDGHVDGAPEISTLHVSSPLRLYKYIEEAAEAARRAINEYLEGAEDALVNISESGEFAQVVFDVPHGQGRMAGSVMVVMVDPSVKVY